jgi:hypothetical protein
LNLVQASIAHATAAHFRRQWRQMARNGPYVQIKTDQITYVNDLVALFTERDKAFDAKTFRELCFKED